MLTLGEGRLPTGAKLRFLKVAPTYRAWGFVVPIPSQFCPLVQEIQSLWGLVGSRNQLRELGGGGAREGAGANQRRLASFLPRCLHRELRTYTEPRVSVFSKAAENLDLNMESLKF